MPRERANKKIWVRGSGWRRGDRTGASRRRSWRGFSGLKARSTLATYDCCDGRERACSNCAAATDHQRAPRWPLRRLLYFRFVDAPLPHFVLTWYRLGFLPPVRQHRRPLQRLNNLVAKARNLFSHGGRIDIGIPNGLSIDVLPPADRRQHGMTSP